MGACSNTRVTECAFALDPQALATCRQHLGGRRRRSRVADWRNQRSGRSAMVMPTMIYALVLQAFEEVEAAATVRGWLPRRLTVLLVAELVELDRWLATQLPPDNRRQFATRGGSMDPREIQRLAHDMLSKHLELHDETTFETTPGQLPEAATRT